MMTWWIINRKTSSEEQRVEHEQPIVVFPLPVDLGGVVVVEDSVAVAGDVDLGHVDGLQLWSFPVSMHHDVVIAILIS